MLRIKDKKGEWQQDRSTATCAQDAECGENEKDDNDASYDDTCVWSKQRTIEVEE